MLIISPGDPEITLDQFIGQEIMRIKRFADEWSENNATKPDQYPATLTPGEWDEQYLCYMENDEPLGVE